MSILDSKAKWIMCSYVISNAAYILVAPFLPLELEKKGLPASYTGIVFALYSVGSIVWSPIVAKHVDRVGSSNLLGLALGIMGATFICFGLIEVLTNKAIILTVACFLRLVQGITCSTCATTILTIWTNEYPIEQREKLYGYHMAMGASGLVFGPLVGSVLYSLLGFKNTFFVYGSAVVIFAFILRLKLGHSDGDD